MKTKPAAGLPAVLKAIYPPYVLALAFIPFLVGLFIHYQLIDFRELMIMLVWIPVFTIPGLLLRIRLFYYLLVILSFINGLVNLGHWLLIKGPISASSLFVFFNTNYREAVAFVSLKSGYRYLLLLPYLLIFILALNARVRLPPIRPKSHRLITLFIGLGAVIFIFENAFHERLTRKGIPVLFKATISFYQEVQAYQKLRESVRSHPRKVSAVAFPTAQRQLCLLIIGESANRNHMSLYGYNRETNPRLSRMPGLMVYDDVLSGYSHTLESVPASISEANLENRRKPYDCFTLLDVFHAAGFKTYWLSNQNPLGVWDNFITLIAGQADETRFVNVSASSSFESNEQSSYDGKLFEPLIHVLNEASKRQLVILHLMGSHSSYDKRYPPAFNRFHGSTKRDQLIAAYDNSILYNDFVVDSLIKIVRAYSLQQEAVSAVVYLSDHGENVYDEGDYAGHDYSLKLPNSNIEIPFLVWCSPEYERVFSKKTRLIAMRQHAPFITDDLFHAMIDLFEIKTPVFVPSRSIFHPKYNRHRDRILVDGHRYENRK